MKKCKHCKERFTPIRSTLEKFCKKDECIRAWIDFENAKKAIREKREWIERRDEMKVVTHASQNKKILQGEINKLARMIDNRFNHKCIDCNKPYGKQQDAGHFTSVGANKAIRYNLHNIHSQKSDCNQNGLGGGKQLGYYEGLIKRYGKEYADFVRYELPLKYNGFKLPDFEIVEKIKIVRKLVRDFDTFAFPVA